MSRNTITVIASTLFSGIGTVILVSTNDDASQIVGCLFMAVAVAFTIGTKLLSQSEPKADPFQMDKAPVPKKTIRPVRFEKLPEGEFDTLMQSEPCPGSYIAIVRCANDYFFVKHDHAIATAFKRQPHQTELETTPHDDFGLLHQDSSLSDFDELSECEISPFPV